MDREDFSQTELNRIDEFRSFRAEFFGVPEHSRPKMENYSLEEFKRNSLPEDSIQDNEIDGYTKKLMENAQGTGTTSGSSAGDLGGAPGSSSGLPNVGSLSGAGSSSAAGSISSTVASAAGVGTVVATAVVGGAALGVVPVLSVDFGTFSQTNYISEVVHEDDKDYQLLTFNFSGEIKPEYVGEIVDEKTGEVYEVNIENPVVQIKKELDEQSSNYTFQVKNIKSKNVVFKKEIVIDDLGLDFSDIEFAPVYKTTYIKETNSSNLYFYLNSNYYEKYNYPITNVNISVLNETEEKITFDSEIVKELEQGYIYVVKNIPLNYHHFYLTSYINKDNNLFGIDTDIFLKFDNTSRLNPVVEGEALIVNVFDENPLSDVEIEVTHDDDSVENFVISKEDLVDGKTVIKKLSKESIHPKLKATYLGATEALEDEKIEPSLLEGESKLAKVFEDTLENDPLYSYGGFEYENFEVEHIEDPIDPHIYTKNVYLYFKNNVNLNYYVNKIDPVTGDEILFEGTHEMSFMNVPLEINQFEYKIYCKNGTENSSDDYLVKDDKISIEDKFTPPPVDTNYGTFKFNNYEIYYYFNYEDYSDYNELTLHFNGELNEGFEAKLENLNTHDIVNLDPSVPEQKYNFLVSDRQKYNAYKLVIYNKKFNEAVYDAPITVLHKFPMDSYHLSQTYKTTYFNGAINYYFQFYTNSFPNFANYPIDHLNVTKFDENTGISTPLEYRKIQDNEYGGLYVIEGLPGENTKINVEPVLKDGKNYIGFPTIAEGGFNYSRLNMRLDAQKIIYTYNSEKYLSDITFDVVHDNDPSDTEVHTIPLSKAQGGYPGDEHILLNKFSNNTKITVSYDVEAPSYDYEALIDDSLLEGSFTLPVSIEKITEFDPKMSYGTFNFLEPTISYRNDTVDPSKELADITFNFESNFNDGYYVVIVNPIDDTLVYKEMTGSKILLYGIPAETTTFTYKIYYDLRRDSILDQGKNLLDDYEVFVGTTTIPQKPSVM